MVLLLLLQILAGKIEFPRHFDVHAKDLIKKLLTADRSKRLGNLKGAAEDVKKHKVRHEPGHMTPTRTTLGRRPSLTCPHVPRDAACRGERSPRIAACARTHLRVHQPCAACHARSSHQKTRGHPQTAAGRTELTLVFVVCVPSGSATSTSRTSWTPSTRLP